MVQESMQEVELLNHLIQIQIYLIQLNIQLNHISSRWLNKSYKQTPVDRLCISDVNAFFMYPVGVD